MISTDRRRLRPNAQWPAIIAKVLAKDAEARAIMWEEVQHFLLHVIKLPIGPHRDDEDALRDIATSVLQKLEAKDCYHLASWLARQHRKIDHSSFWGFVKTVAWSKSIDYARTSPLNIARRVARRKGEPKRPEKFEWVRVDCIDTQLLGEVLGNPHSLLVRGDDQELAEVLAEFQRALSENELVIELAPDEHLRAFGGQTSWR
jgi:hypothetical protein